MNEGSVEFRPFEQSEAALLAAVHNDQSLQRATFRAPALPIPPARVSRRLSDGHPAPLTGASGALELAVVTPETGREPVGVVGFYDIDWLNRCSEVGVTIFDPTHRGKGYGSLALVRALELAFDHWSMWRCYCHIKADNPPGLSLAEASGMLREGLLREHRLVSGTRVDVVVVSMLSAEWTARP